MFLSRKGGSQKCLGFRLPGFSALCNKQSKNCTQPLQSLFPRGGCVCIMCTGESNFWYIFADSLNCKLIGYNKKLCKWENSKLLNKKIEDLKAIPADSFLLIALPKATFNSCNFNFTDCTYMCTTASRCPGRMSLCHF